MELNNLVYGLHFLLDLEASVTTTKWRKSSPNLTMANRYNILQIKDCFAIISA
jgi:hypothetical protein